MEIALPQSALSMQASAEILSFGFTDRTIWEGDIVCEHLIVLCLQIWQVASEQQDHLQEFPVLASPVMYSFGAKFQKKRMQMGTAMGRSHERSFERVLDWEV